VDETVEQLCQKAYYSLQLQKNSSSAPEARSS